MIRYRYDYRNATVTAVECEHAGYPHPDADGKVQYENTHFDTEDEAWENLDRESRAGVSLAVVGHEEALSRLDHARTALCEAATIRHRVEERMTERSARQPEERQS